MSGEREGAWRVVLFTDQPMVATWYKGFLAEKGHRLVAAVTSSKRDFPYLDVVRALQPEVDVLVSNHPKRWAEQLRPLRPDLIIATIFPWRLPAELLALPRLGAVNVHPALLPRYRGTMIMHWMLRNGEREAGATLHRMAADFDSGPILAQERVAIDDDDVMATLGQKISGVLPALWETALPRIARGDAGEPQDEAAASYFGRITDEAAWRRIDWSLPARTIHNVVRSCAWAGEAPPGAIGPLDGVAHRVTRTRLAAAPATDAVPGAIIARDSDTMLVQCGDGALHILEHRPI